MIDSMLLNGSKIASKSWFNLIMVADTTQRAYVQLKKIWLVYFQDYLSSKGSFKT